MKEPVQPGTESPPGPDEEGKSVAGFGTARGWALPRAGLYIEEIFAGEDKLVFAVDAADRMAQIFLGRPKQFFAAVGVGTEDLDGHRSASSPRTSGVSDPLSSVGEDAVNPISQKDTIRLSMESGILVLVPTVPAGTSE